ncbi:WD40-repeat-containing domain protein [Syncephalis pseudoplumigaleata]|uniref:WD40-repeat-containing domain protein n=1 Tax=Syncephalis pseudoplumigaleata TaxID=1712513 RepID=A0A4P9Z744_9FUNG|nr:WD40-repeat-containing domain protein [Syncephalis pseudoplumigaleata]|eukprot:RKP27510.1 WD40-repeat-containing domain protein [Syncephalis pseudoplumigaleata]
MASSLNERALGGDAPAGDELSAAHQEQLDRVVLAYLKRKGYRTAEDAFKREARLQTLGELSCELQPGADASITDYVLYYSQAEQSDPRVYQRSFASLLRWLDTSLDMYRPELRATLFPIFAHVYLEMLSKNLTEEARQFMEEHGEEISDEHPVEMRQLRMITSGQHVRESEFARTLLSEKYNLRMSDVALRLLVSFLLDQKHMLLLRIVSQRLNIQVLSDYGDGITDDLGVIGQTAMEMDTMNQKPVQLATPALDAALSEEIEQALRQADPTEAVPAPPAPSVLVDKFKELQKQSTTGENVEPLPLPPPTEFDIRMEVKRIKDLAKQTALDCHALPSICCYTVHNTNDNLHCMAFSEDLSLMACGFSDSYVQLWSLDGQPLRGLRSDLSLDQMNQESDLLKARDDTDHTYRRLIGHSGPVYGLSFSPDSRFLLSSSEDSTVRLWSLDTYSNVVCYRGHNYPVWDVEFGPYGFYFATASHDRTARLWSTEHPYPLRIFAGHLSDVDCLKFHPNSRYLLTGSSDQTVRMWDVQHGQCVRVLKDHRAPIYALATSSDGRLAASAGADKIIRLWDLGSGRLIKRFHGHQSSVYSLAFSAEGNLLCSGSADETVRVWDVTRELTETEQLEAKAAMKEALRMASLLLTMVHMCSVDLLGTYPTKSTPIYKVHVTRRNLAIVGGAFLPQPS